MDQFRNFAISTVALAPVPPTSGTALTIAAGDGVYFAPVPFNVVVCPAGTLPTAPNAEILRVTAKAGDVFTIARMQEGSQARNVVAGDQIYQGLTEKLIDDLFAAMTPGPQGEVGPQGPAGPQGPVGPQGPEGTAGVDATYWTVSPSAGLVNERALNALANGYVKSPGGEPSTVASIPVADGGTGASSAAGARTNLGLGTLAVQNENAISTTGGTIGGATLVNTTNWVYAFAFVGDGSNLTNLNAARIATGLVAPARLGSGTPSAATYLRGDQTWAAIGDIFPSGLIVIANGPCPPGWTRVSPWDGYFLMGSATPFQAGGAATHAHGPGTFAAQNHSHGPGSLASQNHTHGAGSFAAANHNHGASVGISGSTGSAGDHTHPFSGTGVSAGSMNADAGASGNVSRDPHTHGFTVTVTGDTDSRGAHTHSFSGSGSIPSEAPAVNGASAAAGALGIVGASDPAGALGIVGASDPASNLPPYVTVSFCQKN